MPFDSKFDDDTSRLITSVLLTMNGRWLLLNLPVREIGASPYHRNTATIYVF